MQIRIEKIVYSGRSLARLEGRIVFTDEGLPGELVEIEPIKEKKNFLEARTIGIIERSAQRTAPLCDHYKVCSPWQIMKYDLQLELKGSQVREIFRHELGIEPEDLELVPSPKIWGYRNRAKFHVLWDDGNAYSAYHEPGSRDSFIKASFCRLVSDEINDFLEEILGRIQAGGFRGVSDIEIRRSDSEARFLVALRIASEKEAVALRRCLAGIEEKFPLAGIVGLIETRRGPSEVLLIGKKFIEEELCGIRFRIGAGSFFQVNTGQLTAVAEELRRAAGAKGDPKIADLYSGIGTFGLFLAREAKEVFAVEPEPGNIDFLKKNIALNRVGNMVLGEGRSEDWIGEILGWNVDFLILDPPRRGVHPALVQEIVSQPVETIAYLSCNPATLARDLKGLLRTYTLGQAKIFDFFPHTPHIETLVILNRK